MYLALDDREDLPEKVLTEMKLTRKWVLALKSLRKKVDKEELSHGKREGYTYLILCTVSGVAAGLQNTG